MSTTRTHQFVQSAEGDLRERCLKSTREAAGQKHAQSMFLQSHPFQKNNTARKHFKNENT